MIRFASHIVIVVSFMISAPLTAQTLRFLEKSDFQPNETTPTTLELLGSELLLEELTYIGLLEAAHQDFSALYYAMHHASTDARANIYKVRTFITDTLDSAVYSVWELYLGTDSTAALNQSLKLGNMAYVFAPFDEEATIRINGIKQHLKPGTWFEYALIPENVLKINHGGATGVTYKCKVKKDGSNTYLTTGKGSAGTMIGVGGIGVGLSTGSLIPVHPPLAEFMLEVYRR